jgi:hypothetical protein
MRARGTGPPFAKTVCASTSFRPTKQIAVVHLDRIDNRAEIGAAEGQLPVVTFSRIAAPKLAVPVGSGMARGSSRRQ